MEFRDRRESQLIYERLLKVVSKALKFDPLSHYDLKDHESSKGALEELVAQTSDQGYTIVLFLDEFRSVLLKIAILTSISLLLCGHLPTTTVWPL